MEQAPLFTGSTFNVNKVACCLVFCNGASPIVHLSCDTLLLNLFIIFCFQIVIIFIRFLLHFFVIWFSTECKRIFFSSKYRQCHSK